ncbi:MAG: hypothetical protein IT372_02150, partial [Polyangiaceae bacterium]|nr:hypothetical protein [Polyangiaceae bacterium]
MLCSYLGARRDGQGGNGCRACLRVRSGAGGLAVRDIYYISTARCASDSNCGRSWADAFATIERALAELGQSQGVVEVGPGEYKAPSAGYTLHAEQTLRSAGMGTVRIDAAGVGADTPVINVVGGRSHVRGFWMVRVHGIGIHVTNTQTGSTQNVLIEDMLVGTTGSGAIAYGIGVRPRAGSSDVSEVLLLHCISNGNETTTHMKIGYGGTGNVLDVTNIGGNSQVNKYGIVIAGGSLVSTGLNFQKSAEADIVCEANAMGQIHISGGRSESAYRFLDHTRFAFQDYNGLLIENYTVFALQNTDGQAVITKHGPLRLNNVTLFGQHCPQYVAYVLEGVLPDGDYLRQTEIDGLASEHPYPIGASPYSRPGRIIEAKNVRFVGDVDFQARANRSPERQVRRKNVHENLPFKLDSRYAMEFVVGLESHAGTVTLTPGVVGQIVGLTFEQNGLGGFSYTWPASCAFDAGSAPANVTT